MKKGFVTKLFTGLLVGALAFGMVPNVAFAEGNTEAAAEELTIGEKEYLFGTTSNTATPLTANVTLTEGYTAANSNTVTASGNLYAGGSTYGSSSSKNPARWYKYTTTDDGYVTFTLKKNDNTDLDGSGWDLKIYEQGNSDVLEHYDNITGSQTTYRYNLPAGKTLLVKVDTRRNGEYRIPVNSYYDLTANQTAVSGWETEDNDSTSTADEIVNGSIIGTTYNTEDVDYFKFNVTEKSYVRITLGLELANIEDIDGGWAVTLYKEGNANAISSKTNWNKEDTWTVHDPDSYSYSTYTYSDLEVSPGTYYLRVNGYARDHYNIPYHFTIATEKVVPTPVTMYRLYNPNSGEHFYTADSNEKDALAAIGWTFEGVAWTAPDKSDTPVYRMYNKNSGEHHYTMNAAERDMLKDQGWKYEGIGWYSADNQVTPLYRLYNPNATGEQEAGAHHYTTDAAERDMLISIGWNNEGTGWYGM